MSAEERSQNEEINSVPDSVKDEFSPLIRAIVFARHHFEVLGLPETTDLTPRQVSQAYRNAAMRVHPDKNSLTNEQLDKEVAARYSESLRQLKRKHEEGTIEKEC